jgi:anti-sigma regulatory factor (Ser/Thr protein kinase)
VARVIASTLGCRTFDSQLDSLREARQFVRDCPHGTAVNIDDAVLLTSELATNAVIHAQPEVLPVLAPPTDNGGRGLHLVEAIASRWGIESDPDHKLAWFELQDLD